MAPDGTVYNMGNSFVRGEKPSVKIIEFPASGERHGRGSLRAGLSGLVVLAVFTDPLKYGLSYL